MFHCDEPVQMLITPVISLAPTVHRFHRDIIMKMSDNAGFRHSRVNFVSKTGSYSGKLQVTNDKYHLAYAKIITYYVHEMTYLT